MATLSNTDLKPGVVFKEGSHFFQVVKYDLVKKARGSSNVKIKVRNLKTGALTDKTFGGNETADGVDLTRTNAQYLYADADSGYFMDAESYDQFSLSMDSIGNMLKYVKEGEKVITLKLDGEAISIEVPISVVLKVEYTEPGVKGDTANNALKEAKLETGAVVKVPLFIEVGDMIKVNTENGTYTSKG